ncbi:MAG: putative two-component system sensor histidine kinase, putative heat shock protein [Alphaproteobacteria bacterium]|nr:putative two-component system sensor histidine kinase, putative heat shock protein [Alphaproteobacteria bacterium]
MVARKKPDEKPPETGFSVDTKLFQELGELLVAKESTALVELIKNAYDADATLVTVQGSNLGDPQTGRIAVSDDGIGMSGPEFRKGFLTIAGRTKNKGDRRSPIFGRRYTGEKGVGRLASHKLGTYLMVESRKAGPARRGARKLPKAISRINATIDWNAIERLETLDQVPASRAVTVSERAAKGVDAGTTLTIGPLRSAWTDRIKSAFLREAVTLAPAPILWSKLPANTLVEQLVFRSGIPVRDQRTADPGFQVKFAGDLELGDQLIPDVAQAASWVAEIDFNHRTGLMRVAISPTKAAKREFPASEGFSFERKLGRNAGPSFQSRIFQQSKRTWAPAVQGIRVFMEGFRVPPYGDPHDDWLDLESDYKSRARRQLTSLSNLDLQNLPAGLANEELVIQGNAAYMGAVFLHRASSGGLQMLVNREGFLPGPDLEFIGKWVRIAIDLIVRLGFVARKEVSDANKLERNRKKRRKAAGAAGMHETPVSFQVRESAIAAEAGIQEALEAIERSDFAAAAESARNVQPRLEEIRELADDLGGEALMWRVLASLGAELAAFVHEVNAIGLQIGASISDLDTALAEEEPRRIRTPIRRARRRAIELAERIKRNAVYLVDATSFEGRRRRSRQPLRDRFENIVPFFQARLTGKRIRLSNEIPEDIRTPPMFPAELSGIFTNLLSNAVKFTGDRGKIRIGAREFRGMLVVRMENSGQSVSWRRSAKLFEAFQSTTEQPDAILGQGMGMGLTITRNLVHEYGGDIRFVAPLSGFATALQFSIPLG